MHYVCQRKPKRLLIIGIIGCLLYVIGGFLLAAVTQIKAFAKGHTPLPRRCWVFSVLFGFVFAVVMRLIGNYSLTDALATSWISIGNLWMMSEAGGMTEFVRQYTLASGGPCCDCGYKKRRR